YLKIVDWINHLELDEEEISFSVTDNLANIIKDSQPIPVNMGSESKDYSPIFKSFKIANTSVVGELHLRDLEVSAQNFSIHETFSKAKLLPGESAVFIIKLNTNVAGNFT